MATTIVNGTAAVTTAKPKVVLDAILTAQLIVAWAGEAGDAPRLKWWRTDLASEFGGKDLFKRLLPHTWQWAVLEGAREAARRRDAELRAQDADPDRLITLFRLGFEIDEHVDEHLADLKRSGQPPADALAGLRDVIVEKWSKPAFTDWISGHGETAVVSAPVGRRLKGEEPQSAELLVKKLVAALHPLADAYPMPHYRRATG
ncbi:MAG: BREX-6 system BrxE protein [Deltaproteobacteria bacterium]|nr:BREX-6 system BrxE protein [Deltaproteobacteria bacterium]